MTVRFVVPGPPVPKPRPRVARGRAYTPPRYAAWERGAKLRAAAARNGPVLCGPVRVDVTAYLPIPRSWPGDRQQQALFGAVMPATKPDLDNILKAALDVCNGAVYGDDAQVVEVFAAKRYGAEPELVVVVTAIEP